MGVGGRMATRCFVAVLALALGAAAQTPVTDKAAEASLNAILTAVNRLPVNLTPAQEHTFPASPTACRLSDGSTWLTITNGAISSTVLEDTTNNVVKVGDATNKAVRVNIVAGAGAGGTSSVFNVAFPAAGTAAGFLDTLGKMQPGNLDGAGNIKVNVVAGGSGGGTVDQGNASGAQSWLFNLNKIAGTTILTGNGPTGAGSPRVTLADDNSPLAVKQSGVWTMGRTWTLSSGTDSIAAAQSGTWNLNNIAGTITLPTGAATGAKQDTGNGSLASIDGDLTDDVAATAGADEAAVNRLAGTFALRLYNSGASANQRLQIWPGDSANGAKVQVSVALPAGGNTIGAVTQASGPWTENLTQIAGTTILTGNGVTGAGSQRVTIASDNTPFSVNAVQSGVWSVGRTWTLASGTDSIAAAQSGTWNVNNIGGTVSLPTNAAQETGGNLAAAVANQTNGSQKAQHVDGSGNVQPAGDIDTRSVHILPAGATTNFSDAVYVSPASTPTALTAHAARSVCVYNLASSQDTVYVGGSASTAYPATGGIPLPPGGDPICRAVANASQLFVFSFNGATLHFDGVN